MRIVVVGATGNVGTSVLEALGRDAAVESVLGLARRPTSATYAKTAFAAADVTRDDLVPHFRGADCVIHLAWLIQPSRDERALWETNVEGSSRVLAAVAAASVPALVVASSIGVYSPGPKERVDESWPRDGIPTSWYSRHKAELERRLDRFEAAHDVRTVRLRPGLIMKRESAEEVRRLFAGPFFPSMLARPSRLPVVPHVPGAVAQLVHSRDVGEAYRLAATRDVRGAFNVAAEPEVDGRRVAAALGARTLTVPARVARALATATWRARLQPTSPTGSTSRSACPCSTARGPARSWAGPRGATGSRRSSSCSRPSPTVRAARRRRCEPVAAWARSRPASVEIRVSRLLRARGILQGDERAASD